MGGLCTGDVHIGAVCQGCALGGVLVCVLGGGCVLACVPGLCTGMCTRGCVLGGAVY